LENLINPAHPSRPLAATPVVV